MASWEPNHPRNERPSVLATFALLFVVGVLMTTLLLVLAGQRGHADDPVAGWTWSED